MAKLIARALSQFFDSSNVIKPNDIVEGESALIKALEKAGFVDSNKEAVAYAKSSGGKKYDVKGDGVDYTDPEDSATKAAAALTEKQIAENKAKAAELEKKLEALSDQLKTATDADKPAIETQLKETQALLDSLK